jgi:hypothetical protein
MDPVTGISLGRIIIGISAFLAPELTARLFGLSPAGNPHLPYMSRLFGAREVAVGAITLASRGSARRNLTVVGMAIDASDAVTGVTELQQKRIPLTAAALLVGAATGAVVSGGLALVRNRASA